MAYTVTTTAGTGTVTVAVNSDLVTGTGTAFGTGIVVGSLFIVGEQWGYVTAIQSTTQLTLDRKFYIAVTGAAFTYTGASYAVTQTSTWSAGAGTISLSLYSSTVTGVGTNFTSAAIGKYIRNGTNYHGVIISVESTTSCTILGWPWVAVSGVTYEMAASDRCPLASLTAGAGTVTITFGAKGVTGSGTNFTASDVGRYIVNSRGCFAGRIASVASTTSAQLEDNAVLTMAAGSTYSIAVGLPGVNMKSNGPVMTFETNTMALALQGPIWYNPDYQRLIFSEAAQVTANASGTFTMGYKEVVNGRTRYAQGLGLVLCKPTIINANSTASQFNGAAMGRLTFVGGETLQNSTISVVCPTFAENCVLASTNQTNDLQVLRLSNDNSYVRSCTLTSTTPTYLAGVLNGGTLGTLVEMSGEWLAHAWTWPSIVKSPMIFRDLKIARNTALADVLQNNGGTVASGNWCRFINPDSLAIRCKPALSNAKWYTFNTAERELALTVKKSEGGAASAVYYVATAGTSNPPATAQAAIAAVSLAAPRYIGSTNSGTGIAPTFGVYTSVAQRWDGVQGALTDVLPIVYLTDSGTSAGDITLHLVGYDRIYNSKVLICAGFTGVLSDISYLLPDSFVTMSEATASANTSKISMNSVAGTVTINNSITLDDLYDLAKYWKTRPVQTQLEYPTISTQPFNGSGSDLSTAMSIVLSPGVTLSEGTKFKTLTTSGTISGSGVITCLSTDSFGSTGRLTLTGLPTGCDVVILTAGTSTVLQQVDQHPATSYSWTFTGAQTVDVGIIKPGYLPYYIRNLSLSVLATTSLPVALTADRNYQP